jgi:hypothetical protein
MQYAYYKTVTNRCDFFLPFVKGGQEGFFTVFFYKVGIP